MDFRQIVKTKITSLGVKEAAKFYGVSLGTVSNWSTGKTNPSIDAIEMTLAEMPDVFGQTSQEPAKPAIEPELVMWHGRRVMILLPVYRTFCADTHYTLFANYAKYGPDKLAMEMMKRTVIHEARNILIDKFMKSGAETAIMVDDDMILPCGSVSLMNGRYEGGLPESMAGHVAISRIMSHGREKGIVGALYFGRHRVGKAQCSMGFESTNGNAKLRKHDETNLIPMGWVGTGMIKIEKWVIEKLKAHIDAGNWPECKPINEGMWYGYFTPIRVAVGEDVSFGRRAEKIGIMSHLDPQLECLHNGEKNYGASNTEG